MVISLKNKEKAVKKITALVLMMSIGGCANADMNREEMLGTAAGAALGGILGYQFGGGVWMNSLWATVGAVTGGTAGYVATRTLMGTDRVAYDRTAHKGLAAAENGQIFDWKNPEPGNSGIFRPTNSFYSADGRLCRQYRATVAFKDGVRSGAGMACQNPDGQWQVLADDFSRS